MIAPLTTTELAARFRVSPCRVRQWVAEGRLKPAITLANGQHLFAPGTKRPKDKRRGRPPL